jgi:hypothetical protein
MSFTPLVLELQYLRILLTTTFAIRTKDSLSFSMLKSDEISLCVSRFLSENISQIVLLIHFVNVSSKEVI